MRSIIVVCAGLIFLFVGIEFYSMASNLNQLGPIKFGPDTADTAAYNTAQTMAMAASSGFKAYVANKLTLVGEILIGVGAFSWIRIPGKL